MSTRPPPPLPADAGASAGTITSQVPTAHETHALSQRREQEKRQRENPDPLFLHREEDRKLCEDKARELCRQVGINIQRAAQEGQGCYSWNLDNHQVLLSPLAEYQQAAVVDLVEQALRVQGYLLQVLSPTCTLVVWNEKLVKFLSELGTQAEETREGPSSPMVSTYQRQGDGTRHLRESVLQSPLQRQSFPH